MDFLDQLFSIFKPTAAPFVAVSRDEKQWWLMRRDGDASGPYASKGVAEGRRVSGDRVVHLSKRELDEKQGWTGPKAKKRRAAEARSAAAKRKITNRRTVSITSHGESAKWKIAKVDGVWSYWYDRQWFPIRALPDESRNAFAAKGIS